MFRGVRVRQGSPYQAKQQQLYFASHCSSSRARAKQPCTRNGLPPAQLSPLLGPAQSNSYVRSQLRQIASLVQRQIPRLGHDKALRGSSVPGTRTASGLSTDLQVVKA